MNDFQFYDPEQLQLLHQQKMEEMKVLMNKIVDDPSKVKMDDLQQAIKIFDRNPIPEEEND